MVEVSAGGEELVSFLPTYHFLPLSMVGRGFGLGLFIARAFFARAFFVTGRRLFAAIMLSLSILVRLSPPKHCSN